MSPTKPTSILATPRTVNGRRKNVAFGKEVVDNEGKKRMQPKSRTGLPNDCPGKFPSPYTPKEKQMLDSKTSPNLSGHFTRREHAERSNPMTSAPHQRSKDDADITLDVMEPRSESGRYWKDLHTTYAQQSERQVRKLIAKQKLAKRFAKAKDAEATEATTKLESERKKFRSRSKELDDQLKGLKEQLRIALAENAKYATEVAVMKQLLEAAQQAKPTAGPTPSNDTPKALSVAQPGTLGRSKDLLETSRHAKRSLVPARTSSKTPQPVGFSSADPPTLIPTRKAAPDGSKVQSPWTSPSSGNNPLSSPTATATARSAHSTNSYRVSKKPVMTVLAKTRTPQTVQTRSKTGRVPLSELEVEPRDDELQMYDDLDLWDLANLESSATKTTRTTRTRVNRPTEPSFQQATTSTTPKESPLPQPTSSTSARARPDPIKASTGGDFPALLTREEKLAKSPRHFPGSPAVRAAPQREPLGSSVGTGNARTKVSSDKASAATARILARRAARAKAKAETSELDAGEGKQAL